jgi:two-component system, NtrC family, response regulator AtoC
MHDDPLASQPGEDAGVRPPTANHLRQHRRNHRDLTTPRTPFGDKRAQAIPPMSRPVGKRGQGFAVEEKHQPVFRRGLAPRESHSATIFAAHSSVCGGIGLTALATLSKMLRAPTSDRRSRRLSLPSERVRRASRGARQRDEGDRHRRRCYLSQWAKERASREAVVTESAGRVLVVDDDAAVGEVLIALLERAGHRAWHVRSAGSALESIDRHGAEVVISDIRMPEMDGMELLGKILDRWPDLPVVMLTAHGSVPLAVEAMRAGAADFMLKPFDRDEILFVVRKALEAARGRLDAPPALTLRAGPFVTQSPNMRPVLDLLARAARSNATVLIQGETGTGKEVAARAIHETSGRRAKPFVAVHCAALPDSLLESELFGYEKGAFTGAAGRKPGRIEIAQGGTVLLDEIGDVTPQVQVKLLRVLQERSFERLGGTETVKADVRFVAATHRDLEAMVRAGTFREDLFYRLNVVPIVIPPLRARPEDIEPLALKFLATLASANGRPRMRFEPQALARLREPSWPGNVRQLQNFIERLVVLSDGDTVRLEDVERETARGQGPLQLPPAAPGETLDGQRRAAEATALRAALDRAGGNRLVAARLLGISRRTLYYKLSAHGIG